MDGAMHVAASSVLGQGGAADDSARRQADDLLGRARQSLAEGNLETADSLISRAESLNVAYGLFHMGDSPKKARRDLEKARESRGGKPTANDPFAAQAATMTAPPTGSVPAGSAPAATPSLSQTPFAAAPSGGPPSALPAANPNYPTTASAPPQYPPADANPRILPLPTTMVDPNVQPASAVAPLGVEAGAATGDAGKKQRVLELVRQARAALAAGDVAKAESLAREADGMGVPDREFGPQDDRAWLVLMEVTKLQRRGAATPAAASTGGDMRYPTNQALYDPNTDATRNVPAAAAIPIGGQPSVAGESEAARLLNAGEAALRNRDMAAAQSYFKQAAARRSELDPVAQQRLDDRLTLAGAAEPIGPGRTDGTGLIDQAVQAQQLQARQISSEVAKLEQQSEQAQGTDPAKSQALLQQARVLVEKSPLDGGTKELLLRRIDRDLAELNKYVETNRSRIELSQRNREVKDSLDREQSSKIEMQEKLARLVEEYNTLIDQQRFAEAEVVAKRAGEIAPKELVSLQLQAQSKAWRRMMNNADIRGLSEEGVYAAMASVDRSAAPFDDSQPIQFPKNWSELRGKRGPIAGDSRRRSPKELEIEQRLKTPVSLKFANAPISQVFEKLSAMTGVPIYLDQRGLAAEGVDSSTPISIDLSSEISLKSALSLILAEHHLSYVVKDEVLKITSDRMRSEEVYPVTYPVGDLVIPIPNFVPTGRMGLSGALADAQAAVAGNNLGLASHAPIATMAVAGGAPSDNSVLGQMNFPFNSGGGGGGPPASGMQQNVPFGPGGMGGGVQPDFDSLIELLQSTIAPETWREAGGTQGEVKSHTSTLSLVITQTQAVHEQIEDLLNQLRQLQDLQVTIEVRFIRLRDDFYEQIGVDFDMDIDDNSDVPFQVFGRPFTPQNDADVPNPADQTAPTYPFTSTAAPGFLKDSNNPARDIQDRDHGPTTTVGMSAPGVFSADLDIPFSQSSLATTAAALSAIPSFSATSSGGANVGFAILSDIEAYFFITAVQDDNRQNVLQAPKVTMFNGQQAFVSDTAQSPFVISVVPVVGDFAAAQQPVIVVLNEGTALSVQAVVSNDRRFVRLTMVPFFSQIGEVNTFTFEGSASSTRASNSTQGPGLESGSDTETVNTSGTTVQLPTFAFQTVTTTVSVPDGGTVLLGGIKRMTEVRRENGVPMLSKIPYINRLFDNVAIGKASESLMMMVTPRIIIQSEEEAAIGVNSSP